MHNAQIYGTRIRVERCILAWEHQWNKTGEVVLRLYADESAETARQILSHYYPGSWIDTVY